MDEKTIPLSKLPVDVKVQISAKKPLGANLDYRALFEQTGECVLIIGLDFKLIAANQQALRLLKYREDEVIGLPLEDVILLEDERERDTLLQKQANLSESTLKKKDGSLLPVELSISVVHSAEGMPAYIQLLARDISERKQAERALKRHMRALSVIGEATASLFRSPNLEETIPAVLESLGYAVDAFSCAVFDLKDKAAQIRYDWTSFDAAGFDAAAVLQPYLAMIAEAPARVFSAANIQLPRSAPVSIMVIPVQGATGALGYLALFYKHSQTAWLAGEFDAIQTTANLIGAALERLRYERAIQLNEMRNRIIVDALPDLLLRIDLTGRILDYNANTNHPLYLSRKEALGKKLQDLWTPEAANMIIETETQDAFLSSHWVYGFSLPAHEQTFEARLHPISADEALVIVRDITEQARLDQMKSDFINRASHELRTPLTSAILMTELLQQGGSKEETDEYWRVLTGELNRQKEIINQLLLAGRLESGKAKLDAQPLDLMPVLREAVQAIKVIASQRRVSIELGGQESALEVMGDKSGLTQVFVNLINNAVKFSPEGKSVEVRVSLGENEARIEVTDHGLGIPADAQPHLFERFYRARNVTVAEIPGSGIGLYIVKSIVDELGGFIDVHSEVNVGTTFTVRLRLPGA